jgi:hypothetical protein
MSDEEIKFVPIPNGETLDNAFTTTFTLKGTPWFPFTMTLPDKCVITLHADGKWEGSIEALRAALAKGESWGGDGITRMFLWLLLRQMEADQRSW